MCSSMKTGPRSTSMAKLSTTVETTGVWKLPIMACKVILPIAISHFSDAEKFGLVVGSTTLGIQ